MRSYILPIFFIFICISASGSRKEILINNNWMFRFSHQVLAKSEHRIDMPPTQNASDALSGKQDYDGGIGYSEKLVFIQSEWQSRHLFPRFEEVRTETNVRLNILLKSQFLRTKLFYCVNK